VKSGKIEWFVKMDRICPLSGKVYDDKRLLKKHLRSAKTEILRLVAELDSDELRAVLTKDEPETFKVEEEVLEEKLLRKIAR
jgi:hypothetical protein